MLANKQEAVQTKTLASANGGVVKKERLTIDWFAKVVSEFRAEVSELQEAQSNTTRTLQQRNRCGEDLLELRDDFNKLNLELSALRLHQDTLDQSIKELQAEAIQHDDDIRRSQLQVSGLFVWHFVISFSSFVMIQLKSTNRTRSDRSTGVASWFCAEVAFIATYIYIIWYCTYILD